MPDTPISAVLTDDDVEAILDDYAKADEKLAFLVNLSAAERKRVARFGDADLPFVRRTAEVGRQFPDVLPRRVDVEAQEAGLRLYEQLDRVRIALTTRLEKVRDTQRAVGKQVFRSARDVYAAVKRSQGESDALDAVAHELARHFDLPARPRGDAPSA